MERAATQWGFSWNDCGNGFLARGYLGSVDLALWVSSGWMNQTGSVLKEHVDRLCEIPQDLLVVHDDLDLAFGRVRIKRLGGSGGHRGVHSILTALYTDQFPRLKIGIGPSPHGQDPAGFVVSPFSPEELEYVDVLLSRAVSAMECIVTENLEFAMNRFHGRQRDISLED